MGCGCARVTFRDGMCDGNWVRPQELHLQARSVANLAGRCEFVVGMDAARAGLECITRGMHVPCPRWAY